MCRQLQALEGQHARPAEADLPLRRMNRCSRRQTLQVIHPAESGNQTRVVGRSRPDDADDEVAGLDPLAPRHPRRGGDRRFPGKEHHLIDGHDLRARWARHCYRPMPADVSGIGAGESVRNDTLVLGVRAQVITDGARRRLSFDRGSRRLDSLRPHRIQFHRCHHHSIPGRGTRRKIQIPKVVSPLPATTCSGNPVAGTSCRSGKEKR